MRLELDRGGGEGSGESIHKMFVREGQTGNVARRDREEPGGRLYGMRSGGVWGACLFSVSEIPRAVSEGTRGSTYMERRGEAKRGKSQEGTGVYEGSEGMIGDGVNRTRE